MARKRFAIVTFDPDVVQALDCQTNAQQQLGQHIVNALRGTAYAKDRGLLNVTLLDQVAPNARPYDYAMKHEILPPLRAVGGGGSD